MRVFLVCVLFSASLFAQTEIKTSYLDTSKTRKTFEQEIKEIMPPLGFDFSINNSEEINLLFNKLLLSKEEIQSGLTDDELERYMKNKSFLKSLMKLPPNEAEVYPEVHKLRQLLGIAKTAGVLIILLLSIL